MKQLDELLVGISVEDQRPAVGVKRYFQYARFRTGQAGIGKAVAIRVKAIHGSAPPVCGDNQWATHRTLSSGAAPAR